MSLTKVSNAMLQSGPISVFDFMTPAEVYAVQNNSYGGAVTHVTDAVEAALVASQTQLVIAPAGTYNLRRTLRSALKIRLEGEYEATRFKLIANDNAGSHLLSIDATGGVYPLDTINGTCLKNVILDGQGLCADGLYLHAVISSIFENVMATNVTLSGIHLAWAQVCTFINPICSHNHENFTTFPEYGILVDGARPSSANTFLNPILEKVMVSGFKGPSLATSTIISGTSEGNRECGIDIGGTAGCGYNTIVGMDLEVNKYCDIAVRYPSSNNTFVNCASGYLSGDVQLLGAAYTKFLGGAYAGFNIDASSYFTKIQDAGVASSESTIETAYGDGSTTLAANTPIGTGLVNDLNAAGFNIVDNVRDNTSNEIVRSDRQDYRTNLPVSGAATVTVDAAKTNCVEILHTTAGLLTIAAPLNPLDGKELEFIIHNATGGADPVTWNAVFSEGTWAAAATGSYRVATFRYSRTYSVWRLTSSTTFDIATY